MPFLSFPMKRSSLHGIFPQTHDWITDFITILIHSHTLLAATKR
jgi:hypothetical protein